jgi:tRNA pseudouridine synthase 10
MFSLLGTSTTNYERGSSILLALTMENHQKFLSSDKKEENYAKNLKILANKAKFIPAYKVLEKEGIDLPILQETEKCYLCNNIFTNLEPYAQQAINQIHNIEFDNFLIGCTFDSQIINKEDAFKVEFNLLESESIKSHFNREIGKKISSFLEKPPEFLNPDITFIFFINSLSFSIEVLIRSLFIYGRYNKYLRNIPQTHWNCRNCDGKGCEKCNYTGKQYKTSVEELISPVFISESHATDNKFHGGGREDIDVRMLGDGRPFILELRNPKIRTLNLSNIQKKINKKNRKKVKISNLRYSSKSEVKELKRSAEQTRKIYRAKVFSKEKITKETFLINLKKLKEALIGDKIKQRTPNRVSHRRADRIRQKSIYSIDGTYEKSNLFEFIIETQGGVYIKELISGDNGRTTPSFSDIFNRTLQCQALDVLKIYK